MIYGGNAAAEAYQLAEWKREAEERQALQAKLNP
jgi:hypothetical protein